MKPTLSGLFLFVLYGLTTGDDYRIHFYVSIPLNWGDAYTYCNTYYSDMSIVTSVEENQRLIDAGGDLFDAWIGLYEDKKGQWIWVNNQPLNFSMIYSYNPNPFYCGYATRFLWYNGYCPFLRPFFCHYVYKPILVAKNLTWEDAITFCRSYHIDLASATDVNMLKLLQQAIINPPTTSVWIGLRFLAGKWHWVSKGFTQIAYQGLLPSCPAQPYRCGAFNKITAELEMRDCNEMLSFICY
nr:uncharacterized protein LOC101886741 [Danio rerio]|eukprot:XP_009290811.1 uncharacterized protein LOC101886741 [Danio rerio]